MRDSCLPVHCPGTSRRGDIGPSSRSPRKCRCSGGRHSSYKRVVQGKCPLHFLNLNGVVCSNTLFSNASALTSSLLFREILHAKVLEHLGLVEHFLVPILVASCSNKLFVGTVRPSQLFWLRIPCLNLPKSSQGAHQPKGPGP